MTRTLSKIASRLDGEVRQVRSMRQYRDGLADGTLTEADIEAVALRRLLPDYDGDGRSAVRSQASPERPSPPPSVPSLEGDIEDYDRAQALEYLEFAPYLLASAGVRESADPAAFVARIEGKMAYLAMKFDV